MLMAFDLVPYGLELLVCLLANILQCGESKGKLFTCPHTTKTAGEVQGKGQRALRQPGLREMVTLNVLSVTQMKHNGKGTPHKPSLS